jgi:alpha,alpha-trehalose-phosphate synthase [UDP-forming]
MVKRKQSAENAMKDQLKDYTLVIASMSEPYVHNYVKDDIKVVRGTGGVVTGLEPILKLNKGKGIWIAWGRGTADKETVNDDNKIKLPPGSSQYALKRLWITKKNLRGWYYGFANQALWPLCHNVFERPVFNQNDWDSYTEVNKQYAEAILEEVEGKNAIVWIQDYHLALVPKILREKRPDLIIGYFWHIPWPGSNTFKICPWDKKILESMLANQLIGFQRHSFCRNFLDSVSKTLEAKVDFDSMTVTYNNRTTYVRHFPISVDAKAISRSRDRNKKFGKSYIKQFVTGKYEYLSLGVERLDYIKGLPEKIKAIDRFLEKYPEYQEKFVHVNILVPSRTLIKRYEDLDREVETLIENVNFKYATANWQPIHVIKGSLPPSDVYSFYKSANVTMVTSLADGMNLVAKEYVAAGPDDGSLILSEQAGAADELHDAFIVNPYDTEELADTLKIALEMPKEDRKQRIKKMREIIMNKDVYQWAGTFIENLIDINRHLELKGESTNS